jgi:5-methylcytosine-specific restriction endonuclease McrA
MHGLFKGSFTAFDINLEPDGSTSGLGRMDWSQWIMKPVANNREAKYIGTVDRSIEIPQIIVAENYKKTVVKTPTLTKSRIWERDNHTCVYTGVKLKKSELSVDHIIPISRNGKTSWTNLVTTSRKINSLKSDWLLGEIPKSILDKMGVIELGLLYKPYKPKSGFVFPNPTPEQSMFL